MKNKIISAFVTVVMLLSIIAGLSGCGKSGYGATAVSASKRVEIGNLKKDGWMVSIPNNAFNKDVIVSVTKIENGEAYEASKNGFLILPIDISVAGMENVRLNEPVKITMKLDRKNLPDNESFDRTMLTYWNGSEWETIFPDPVRLSEGYLEFETWHFSLFGAKELTVEEQLTLYAREMATLDLLSEKVNKTLEDKITLVVKDYLDRLKVYDQDTRDAIIKRVHSSGSLSSLKYLSDQGVSTEAVGKKIGELIVDSTIDLCQENPLVLKAVSLSLGDNGDAFEALTSLHEGDYAKAGSELLFLAAGYLGYGGMGTVKSVVELSAAVVEQGIIGWKSYEMECAYKAYYGLAKENAYGYKLNKGDWETLMVQIRGFYNQLVRERKDAYKKLYGKGTLTKEEESMLEKQVEDDMKKNFEERAKVDNKIDEKQAEYEKIIKEFKDVGLLMRSEYGFKYDMTIEDRLNSLFRIRNLILDMVGGDISKFGSEKKREENLAWAIKMWLGYNKDRAKFYDWMREQGYLKKLGEETGGYWELVRSFENDYIKSASDNAYSSTWSGSSGSYTYRCEVKYEGISYIGKTHDSCYGEFVENKGTASTPKSRYMGGEQVEIDLTITATTSSNICFHLGASLSASITMVNKDNPFISYGTDTSMYDVTNQITRSYIRTSKNDTNTGYLGESARVGGSMPNGYADGDKVYVLIGMGGGNNFITTAYEYVWHTS